MTITILKDHVSLETAYIPPCRFSDEDWERTAIAYAKWIAARDGIVLPPPTWGLKPRAIWSGVYSKARTNRGRPIWERRIKSVEWGREENVYNTRTDGRQGAWSHKAWKSELTIELPHWDWQPEVIDTSETDDSLPMAA